MPRSGVDDRNAPEEPVVEIVVPFQDGRLTPPPRERVRALMRHLIEALRELGEARRPDRLIQPRAPEATGFAGEVVRAGCGLCRGFCCTRGGTHAYLDHRTMARVRAERPDADARTILRRYAEAVAPLGYEGSCLFHGASGCTLARPWRSELCNSYHCSGLEDVLQRRDEVLAVRITSSTLRMSGGSCVVQAVPGAGGGAYDDALQRQG